jgi:hypothetical protein
MTAGDGSSELRAPRAEMGDLIHAFGNMYRKTDVRGADASEEIIAFDDALAAYVVAVMEEHRA